MSKIARVLVIVEHVDVQTAALRRAVQLARRAGAQLYLLQCVFEPVVEVARVNAGSEVYRLARAQLVERYRRALDAQAAALRESGMVVEAEVLWTAEPHDAVLVRALELEPDFVIKDLRPARRGARRAPTSALDGRLARTCPVPLMFVRPDTPLLPRHIALAVDPGLDADDVTHPLNEALAATALRVATLADADLRLVHAFPFRRPVLAVRASVDLRRLYNDVRASTYDKFGRYADAHAIPADRRHWLDAGEPAPAIVQFAAAHEIDLLVIGSTYHSILSRLLLGSVSEAVLARAACDVLLVKPADFTAQLQRHYDFAALRERYAPAQAAA
ncbi:universal stress protein [Solimonas soli]|uniref:universal stress protein n=1 Tax=Solimonas soli TaxID=413479 RepID=UPI0004853320|nr:universal stress protein [Solimonas soli]